MDELLEYSVVIPVYNSSFTLMDLTAQLQLVMTSRSYELIFVDDGSIDSSWNTLLKIKNENPKTLIKVIKLSRNFGQDNATICGFSFCNGKRIITIDDDLQHPPSEINKLISLMDQANADVVYGLFNNKEHSVIRNIGSRIFSFFAKKFGNKVGIGSAFRIINRSIISQIVSHHQYFLRIEELLLWYTTNIECVTVEHQKRQIGVSGYKMGNIVKLTFNLIFNYSTIPLQIMAYGGFLISLISFIFGAFYIFKKIVFNDPVIGWTTIVVSIMFSTGIIVFSLGVISQYLIRILTLQNNKPCYSISEIN